MHFISGLINNSMTLPGIVFFLLCLLMIFLYVILLLRGITGWLLFPKTIVQKNNQSQTFVSVIVAVRNESEHILNCLNHLEVQNYSFMEVIISDDFSEDTTRSLVQDFINNRTDKNISWKLIQAAVNDKTGKKGALERGISNAKGELIITTDADCTMGNFWVKSFADCYQNSQASMVTGMVQIRNAKSIAEQFQALEFISLTGSGAASVILNKPIMCNGANLAFTRKIFIETGGYEYGHNLATGDDVFLMLQIAQSGQKKIIFNKSKESIVSTTPVAGWNEFISQRKRWASKVSHYSEHYIKMTGVGIILVNMLLILLLPAAAFNLLSWNHAAVIWIIKIAADFIFLFPFLNYTRQLHLLFLFLPASILYPFYIISGLISSPGAAGYSWKGRSY